MSRILVVDDDRAFRLSTSALLEEEGYVVDEAANAQEAADALERSRYDLVLLDLRMPGLDGISLVEVLRTRGEGTPVLMISGFGTVDAAVKALHSGVDDFLTKPVEPEVLIERVSSLLERRPDPTAARESNPGGMVGRSTAMRELYEEIRRVGPTDATVLVTGETGTGKELVARALHDLSDRADGPFVAVDCAALAEGVLESELFGHRKGAFTGATTDREGRFRAADGGTLFLDEIGDIPAGVQQRLLRVIQEREVVPVGDSRPIAVDVRLVAATNKDLEVEVEAGRFREDLLFRLDVYRLRLPPLRDRRGDLPLLAEHYLASRSGQQGRNLPDGRRRLSPLALRLLLAYRWPGNVRQLFAALEGAAIRADGGTIQAEYLPAEIRRREGGSSAGSGAGAEGSGVDDRYRADVSPDEERERIESALEQTDGVRARAAELLGMSRTTLWRKMKEYGISADS